jgi:hypothetical protein
MDPDHARVERRTLNLVCVVATISGALVSQCTLLDISGTDARIALDDPCSVPDEFILRLVRNGTVWRKCKTVWRDEADLGARFLPNRS